MERDELIEKIKAHNKRYPNPPENWDANGTADSTADFVLSLIGTREFIDLQSVYAYDAGQRAERVRIVFELDELLGDVGDGKLARFMDELRADPAEPGE